MGSGHPRDVGFGYDGLGGAFAKSSPARQKVGGRIRPFLSSSPSAVERLLVGITETVSWRIVTRSTTISGKEREQTEELRLTCRVSVGIQGWNAHKGSSQIRNSAKSRQSITDRKFILLDRAKPVSPILSPLAGGIRDLWAAWNKVADAHRRSKIGGLRITRPPGENFWPFARVVCPPPTAVSLRRLDGSSP